MPTFRSTCPRHCYGSCGMLTHINKNSITQVLGDPGHGFTQGRLCPKGYALIQYAMDNSRLKYPMRQIGRRSNEWRKISWEEAYTLIAEKILELNARFNSNLGVGYVKGSGNTGLLHQAVQGMFAGMGPHTRPVGDICSATGEGALLENSGEILNPDPEEMAKAGLIIIWGANPAVTNINQIKFIYEAKKNGTPLVVIDPVFSQSAKRADIYVQINPGTDAWLAWGISKELLARGQANQEFIQEKTIGFQNFEHGLSRIEIEEVCSRTGVRLELIEELAKLYASHHPSANWLGFGLQRNRFGNQSVKAIGALTAINGDLCTPGGGLYYRNQDKKDFPLELSGVNRSAICREVPVSNYPRIASGLQNPPLKMLWISCGNPLSQDHNLRAWHNLFQELELIVTVDLYLTQTVKHSDIVLPASSFFEEEDLHISFWHHWLSINQKILPAFFESKSDLQISRELTRKLNFLQPGFSNFPSDMEPMDWIEKELTSHVKELYGIEHSADLIKNAYKRKPKQLASTWKYRFSPPQPEIFPSIDFSSSVLPFPYRLLTPQSLLKFHTQYETLTWLNSEKEPVIELTEEIAGNHRIYNNSLVEIFNQNGFVRGRAKINPTLPQNVILTEQSDCYSVNALISTTEIDLDNASEYVSIPYNDCMVTIRRVNEHI